jgi:hypothetical protein
MSVTYPELFVQSSPDISADVHPLSKETLAARQKFLEMAGCISAPPDYATNHDKYLRKRMRRNKLRAGFESRHSGYGRAGGII